MAQEANASAARGLLQVKKPTTSPVRLDLDVELAEAIERYRLSNHLDTTSAAARHALRRQLKADGLIQ